MSQPAQILQAFYLLAASTIAVLNTVTPIRTHLITYGPRATATQKPTASPKFVTEDVFAKIAALQVPHAWFKHFYIVSVLFSCLWAVQFLIHGTFLQLICDWNHASVHASMSMTSIELTWVLMIAQGIRRLYESVEYAKPSRSSMWFVHWLLGIAFYLAMSITVWVEGIQTLSAVPMALSSIEFSAPSLKTIVMLPVFILASGVQHDCHAYLSSLQKYTLPVHPVFNLLICPHYTAECMIYLALTFISAPEGMWINRTMLTACVFVTANLAVTAKGTQQWYEDKFGREAVRDRWIMVPFIW